MELGLSGKRFSSPAAPAASAGPSSKGCWPKVPTSPTAHSTPRRSPPTQSELSAGGTTAIGTVVDVADAAALADWVNGSAEALGGIDGVVANVSALAIPDTPITGAPASTST